MSRRTVAMGTRSEPKTLAVYSVGKTFSNKLKSISSVPLSERSIFDITDDSVSTSRNVSLNILLTLIFSRTYVGR